MKHRLLILLLPLLLAWTARAQTLLQQQSFEGTGTDALANNGYTSSTVAANGTTIYFFNANLPVAGFSNSAGPPSQISTVTGISGTAANPSGTRFWASENVRRDAGNNIRGNPAANVTLVPLNVAGKSNLSVTVALADASGSPSNAIARWETDDYIRIQYRFNGVGGWTNVGQFTSDGLAGGGPPPSGRLRLTTSPTNGSPNPTGAELTQALTDYNFSIPGSGNTLEVRVEVDQDGVSEEFGFDNIRVYGSAAASSPPQLGSIEPTALPYAEGSGLVFITNSITVADQDNTTLNSATVTISSNFDATEDELLFTTQNGITGTFPTANTLQLTGSASLANYQTALRSVQYRNTDAADASPLTRTVSFAVTDPSGVTSSAAIRDIAVNAALDPASTPNNYTETFEADGEGRSYTSNHFFNQQGVQFQRVTTNPANTGGAGSPTTFTGLVGLGYWFGENTVNSLNPSAVNNGVLTTKQVNATGYRDLHFQIRLGAAVPNGLNNGSGASWLNTYSFQLFYRTAGSSTWTAFGLFRGTGANFNSYGVLRQDANPNGTGTPTGTQLTTALQNFDFTLPTALNGQTVDFQVILLNGDASNDLAFDQIQVTGTLITPPTVTTTAAGTVATTSAVLGGNVTNGGSDPVTDRGVVYSPTNPTPDLGGTGVTQAANGSGIGPFSATTSGLTPGTTYYVRAYAISTAGTSYGSVSSFTTTPLAPVVSAPANGSSTNDNTPDHTGTAQAGSTVTVYVDGNATPIGTTTATGGNWTLTQPSALTQGAHTVYATAQRTGSAVSANSATNTFTVDTTSPTVAISSTAGASGSTTTTSPIPFTVTFSENVTGFAAGDVTVTNGTVTGGGVNGTSPGTTYTFTVTPTTAGTATTVNVLANVALDAANNGNTAANTYSLTYNVPTATVVSVTRLNPSPTATTLVQYQVVFSRNVSGVSPTTFSVAPLSGSIVGASVSSVLGPNPGTTYTVTVNTGTGTGNGTLRLNVQSSAGITPTVTGLPYTGGEVYTIIRSFAAQPQLSLRGAGSASGDADATAYVENVQVVQNGTTTAVANALQNGSFETNNLNAASADYLYPTSTPAVSAAPWVFSSNAGVARIGGNGFTPPPSGFGSFVGFLQTTTGSGAGSGIIAQNVAVPTGTYQVNFLTAQRNFRTFDQVLNVFLVEGANNVFLGAIQPASPATYNAFTSPAFSVTAPDLTATVSTTSASTTSTAPIPFSVTFSQSVGTTFDASDVTVTGGAITGSISGSGSGPYTFTVTPSGTGTVSVSVAAGRAQDGNNTGNDASNTVSVQYAQPVTAAPVITSPANGSLTNQAVVISGTAPAGSTVAIYVSQNGGTFMPLNVTATASGTFSTPALPFPSSTYQAYATAQSPGAAVSANSAIITFTVDTVRPTVAISSTASASGSTTPTTPIPFTVTFSENVTGFVAGDVTVTNGTITGGIVNGSGMTYTFTVTPTTAGTATTVNVPANVAVDPAGNGNTGAPAAYALTYAQPNLTVAPTNGTLTGGTVGVAYSQVFTATGGNGTYTYALASGTLPAGLTLATNGALSGTPTASGPFAFTVRATDTSTPTAITGTQTYTLTIGTPTITVAPATLPNGTQSTAYSQTLTASGGTAPYSFVLTGGALPAGLTLASNGTLSGTPTASGTFNFRVTATDATTGAGPYSGFRDYALTVATPTSVTWNGNASTDWFTATNWTPATVPTASIDAIIPTTPSGGRFPAITSAASAATVRNLSLNAGATLTQTAGTLTLAGNLTNSGTLAPTGGTVSLGSTALSSILGAGSTRFWNLTVQANGARLATSAGAFMQRGLTLNGNFDTNGNPFTLESNATGTAMVVNNGGAVVVGNVTVQRYIDPSLNPNLGYRHVSAAISSATVGSLATGSFTPVVNPLYNTSATPSLVTLFPTVYGYEQARLATTSNNLNAFDKGWYSPNATSDPLAVGQGYTVLIGGGQTWNFTGPLNNGNVTQTLARNSGATAPDAGYALIGNPYPSPLNWSLVGDADRPNVGGTMYVYKSNDPSNPYTGVYDFYSASAGIGTISPVVAQGQGFFVQVAPGQTNGSVTFKNAHRPTTYTSPAYQRGTAETRPLVELSLQGTGSPLNDAAFVYFEQGATDNFDAQFDAEKLPNPSGLNLSTSLSATQRLAIDGRAPLGTTQQVVPLAVGVPAVGRYTLAAAHILNLGTTPVYLRDLQSGAVIDLGQQPTYSFTVSNASALITGRFELVFSPQAVLATAPASLAAQVAVFPNPASKAVFVELPSALGRKAVTAGLVDALGRTVLTQVLPAGLATHTLPLTNLATGVYSLRLQTEAGVVVKKLVVE